MNNKIIPIKKLKKKIPAAPVAHFPPVLVIEQITNSKLKRVIKRCKTKLVIQTKQKLMFSLLFKDFLPI